MSRKSIMHVYVRYGHDDQGEYTEKVYSPILVPETDELEYIGDIDLNKHKINLNEDTRTYI
jgi:hypothetical protein